MRTLLLMVALLGCNVNKTFECATASDCGANARCEDTKYCSFSDPSCTVTGYRYDEYAGGGLAGLCVGETQNGPDAAMPGDDMMMGCPANYATVGALTTKYRHVTTPASWLDAESDCDNDGTGTHLVIVETEPENDVLEVMLVTPTTRFWIGASDRINEGTYLTVTNKPQTYISFDSGEPTGGAEDCLNIIHTDFADADCLATHQYICECDGVEPVPAAF